RPGNQAHPEAQAGRDGLATGRGLTVAIFMKPLPILALAACLAAPLQAQDIIARAGTETLTADALKPYFEGLAEEQLAALAANPQLLNQAVRAALVEKLVLKEANAAGWEKRPDVAARLARVKDSALAEIYLQEVSRAPVGYPPEAEVRELYEERKADLKIPKQYELAQIYIAGKGEGASKVEAAAHKARVEAVLAKLQAPGADFSAVAAEMSDESTSGSRGGRLGWLAESSLRPEVREAVAKLGKGQTSPPLKLADGTYIVKVLDIREERTATFDEVKDRLAAALRDQRARNNRESYLATLLQNNPVSVNELSLEELVKSRR
ncbi:MAG: peptidyl-prolyl cis-trans isomerase, partial [Terrimicrobiaceae bacterium]|nr:peptidyl-prolyl cis-trans isomerase [Terrimicrobiaceae bacterium]